MNINQLINTPSLVGLCVLLLSLIQIAPIKINPWSWIGNAIGKVIGVEDISKRIDKIDADISDIKKEIQEVDRRNAKTRTRVVREKIISFANSIRNGDDLSNGQFEEMGRWIDEYNKVTEQFDLKNSFCSNEIQYILDASRERGINNEMEKVV